MLAGVATRRHCLVSDPIGRQRDSRQGRLARRGLSLVRQRYDRWFAELLGEDLFGLEVAVLMIDGIVFAKCCCVVAFVVTTDSTKVPVGLWDGDTENATVVKDLLADLVARDLSYEGGGILCVLDGSEALATGVRVRKRHHRQRGLHLDARDLDRRLAEVELGLDGEGARGGRRPPWRSAWTWRRPLSPGRSTPCSRIRRAAAHRCAWPCGALWRSGLVGF